MERARHLLFGASQRTWAYLFRLDPATRSRSRGTRSQDAWIGTGFSLTRDGAARGVRRFGPCGFRRCLSRSRRCRPSSPSRRTRISKTGDQIAAWPKHAREVVRWKSQDGAEIEGVLHKPADFQAGRRYPLLVVIHGGPTGVSRPVPYSNSVGYYPIDLWLARGRAGARTQLSRQRRIRREVPIAQRPQPRHRRRVGRAFGGRPLVAQGVVDRDRVGAMGWSQGGYISAFLTTKHADRFKAISVGAGISNWMTYYVNTDIHPFTRQYLKATPWDDPKIYADTSPMTYIKTAKTPTLIQHGDQDQRVPVPNAFELYQGLRDQNVPVQLVLFKGFGHPLNKPKANRAAMQQNLDWFNKYLWPTGDTTH